MKRREPITNSNLLFLIAAVIFALMYGFAMPISVSSSDQSCALGAAMFAATAAGLYPDVLSAQAAMRPPVERTYSPNPDLTAVYNRLYKKYLALGAFAETSTKVKE